MDAFPSLVGECAREQHVEKVSPLRSFLPSFLLYFFIRRFGQVPPDPSLPHPLLSVGAWPAEIQPAARLLAFQLGLSAALLCSLFDASISFSLFGSSAIEACDEVRSSARPHFISEIEPFRRRGTTSAFGVKWDPRRRGAGGRTDAPDADALGRAVSRSVVFLPHWNGLIFLARQIWRNRGRERSKRVK